MKKAVTIFLLALYTLAAFGATVHAHYCMGRYIGWGFGGSNNGVCTNCGMPKQKAHGCCHDEQRTVILQADHRQASPAAVLQLLFQPAIASAATSFISQKLPTNILITPSFYPPPDISSQKLYLQNRVLLI